MDPLDVVAEVLLADIGALAEGAGEGPDARVLPLMVLQVLLPREALPALGALEEALPSAAANAVLDGNSIFLSKLMKIISPRARRARGLRYRKWPFVFGRAGMHMGRGGLRWRPSVCPSVCSGAN